MHARQLVEIAGLISLRAPALLSETTSLCSDALAEHWIASRCRIDHWGRTLRALGHSSSAPTEAGGGDLLARLSEEITLAEPLTRVVAGLCEVCDRFLGDEEASPIGANLLAAHREAASRLRALRFAWWPTDGARSRQARSLEQQAEQWTDVLLAYLTPLGDVERFAIDPGRLREYAYDSQLHGAGSSEAANQLLAYTLRTTFAAANQTPLNGDLNRRVGGAALALFGSQAFDSHGLSRPLWMLRAERASDDTLALVERLFADEPDAERLRLPARWRI